MPTRACRITLAAAVGVATLTAATAGTVAATGDDTEAPITGPALEHAQAAALDHTGEGRVTATEVGDEDSYYEVEVTLDDGSQVDVQLDRDFTVVDAQADVDEPGSGDAEG